MVHWVQVREREREGKGKKTETEKAQNQQQNINQNETAELIVDQISKRTMYESIEEVKESAKKKRTKRNRFAKRAHTFRIKVTYSNMRHTYT